MNGGRVPSSILATDLGRRPTSFQLKPFTADNPSLVAPGWTFQHGSNSQLRVPTLLLAVIQVTTTSPKDNHFTELELLFCFSVIGMYSINGWKNESSKTRDSYMIIYNRTMRHVRISISKESLPYKNININRKHRPLQILKRREAPVIPEKEEMPGRVSRPTCYFALTDKTIKLNPPLFGIETKTTQYYTDKIIKSLTKHFN